MIFSSSAAIYSPGADLSVSEDSPTGPLSPYARTKTMCEQMFADIAAAEPIKIMSLRYFNPIGADPKLRTGLQVREPTHALGQLVLAMQAGIPFRITGTDYPTPDGSGIRDYVHVWDLAEAHLVALAKFDEVMRDRRRGGDQPGHRPRHVGPRAGRVVQPRRPGAGRRDRRRRAGRATRPARSPAATRRPRCWTGGPGSPSPRASPTRCGGQPIRDEAPAWL